MTCNENIPLDFTLAFVKNANGNTPSQTLFSYTPPTGQVTSFVFKLDANDTLVWKRMLVNVEAHQVRFIGTRVAVLFSRSSFVNDIASSTIYNNTTQEATIIHRTASVILGLWDLNGNLTSATGFTNCYIDGGEGFGMDACGNRVGLALYSNQSTMQVYNALTDQTTQTLTKPGSSTFWQQAILVDATGAATYLGCATDVSFGWGTITTTFTDGLCLGNMWSGNEVKFFDAQGNDTGKSVPDTDRSIFLCKFTDQGTVAWVSLITHTESENSNTQQVIARTYDNGCVVGVHTNNFPNEIIVNGSSVKTVDARRSDTVGGYMLYVKFDKDGKFVWNATTALANIWIGGICEDPTTKHIVFNHVAVGYSTFDTMYITDTTAEVRTIEYVPNTGIFNCRLNSDGTFIGSSIDLAIKDVATLRQQVSTLNQVVKPVEAMQNNLVKPGLIRRYRGSPTHTSPTNKNEMDALFAANPIQSETIVSTVDEANLGSLGTFILEYTGYIKIPTTGYYTIGFDCESGTDLLLDGINVLNRYGALGFMRVDTFIYLTAGLHEITLRVESSGQSGRARLGWFTNIGFGVTWVTIPAENLFCLSKSQSYQSVVYTPTYQTLQTGDALSFTVLGNTASWLSYDANTQTFTYAGNPAMLEVGLYQRSIQTGQSVSLVLTRQSTTFPGVSIGFVATTQVTLQDGDNFKLVHTDVQQGTYDERIGMVISHRLIPVFGLVETVRTARVEEVMGSGGSPTNVTLFWIYANSWYDIADYMTVGRRFYVSSPYSTGVTTVTNVENPRAGNGQQVQVNFFPPLSQMAAFSNTTFHFL